MTEATIGNPTKNASADKAPDQSTEHKYSMIGNLFRGFGQHAIDDTINSITQMVNHSPLHTHIPEVDIIAAPDKDSWAGTIGGVAGDVTKYVGIGALIGATSVVDAPIAVVALTGAAAGALTPQKEDGHFWETKAKNVAIDTATFLAIGGAAKVLSVAGPLANVGGRTFMQDVALGGLSGTAGGATRAEATAVLNEGRLATGQEVVSSAGRYAAFGAIAAGSGHIVNSIADHMTRTVSNYFQYDKQGRLRELPGSDMNNLKLAYDKQGNLVKVTTGHMLDEGGYRTYSQTIDSNGVPRWNVEAKYRSEVTFKELPDGMTKQFAPWDLISNHYTYNKALDYTPFQIGPDGKSLFFTQTKPGLDLKPGTYLFNESTVTHYDWSGAVGPVEVSHPITVNK